jgi:hypothetical protein
VVGVLERKMGGHDWIGNEKIVAQLELPAKMGGMGFRKLGGTASAACLASMASAYAHDKTLMEPSYFVLQVNDFNQRTNKEVNISATFVTCMEALSKANNVQKVLANRIRERDLWLLWRSLSLEELDQLAFLSAKHTSLYWNNPDYGTLLDDGGRYQQMTLMRTKYTYLFRRQLLLENPHDVDASIQHLCQRVFLKTGGMCTGCMDVRLTCGIVMPGHSRRKQTFQYAKRDYNGGMGTGDPCFHIGRDTGYEIER